MGTWNFAPLKTAIRHSWSINYKPWKLNFLWNNAVTNRRKMLWSPKQNNQPLVNIFQVSNQALRACKFFGKLGRRDHPLCFQSFCNLRIQRPHSDEFLSCFARLKSTRTISTKISFFRSHSPVWNSSGYSSSIFMPKTRYYNDNLKEN